MKKSQYLLISAVFVVVFFYGLSVGVYNIFPYELLDSSNDALFGQKTIENNQFVKSLYNQTLPLKGVQIPLVKEVPKNQLSLKLRTRKSECSAFLKPEEASYLAKIRIGGTKVKSGKNIDKTFSRIFGDPSTCDDIVEQEVEINKTINKNRNSFFISI